MNLFKSCPECKNTDLMIGKYMIVCMKCGNLLKEYPCFEHELPKSNDSLSMSCKISYDTGRLIKMLAKKEQKFGLQFDQTFYQELSDFVEKFSSEFGRSNWSRNNLPSLDHLSYRFCENFEYKQYTDYFKLLKTPKIRKNVDNIFNKILEKGI